MKAKSFILPPDPVGLLPEVRAESDYRLLETKAFEPALGLLESAVVRVLEPTR